MTNTATPTSTPTTEAIREHAVYFIEDAGTWLQENWLQIIIGAAAAVAVVIVLHLVRAWALRACKRGEGVANWYSIIGRAISHTGNFFIIMTALKLASSYANPPVMIGQTITFLFTIAAAFQAAIWLRELILGFVEHRTQSEDEAGIAYASALGIIRLLVTIVVFSIALVVVLSNLGVNVTGLVAGLGVGGIAIGLAAQGIFADLFAALAILFDKPFRKGDSIAYEGGGGTIYEIGLKSTRIRAFTGEERIIANKNLLDKEIQNNTLRDHRRAKFAIGVTYQTQPEVLKQIPGILKEIVEANDRTFVRAGFIGFGDSSLDFELEFDSQGPDFADFYDGRTAIGIAILARFNADGIDIAYPTQTTFTAAPDGRMIMPYAEVQPVMPVEGEEAVKPARRKKADS